MSGSTWIDAIPLWAFFPVTVLLVVAAIEVGYRLGQYRRQQSADEKEAPVGAMSAAALGLLAFFLTFTFGFASSRFDERRHAMLDEVNAIGTCYLRSRLLPTEDGTAVRSLLRQYVHERAELTAENIRSTIKHAEEIQHRLWTVAIKVCDQDRSAVTALFVSSLNNVIDLHTNRVTYGTRSRLPGVLWQALILVTVLSMGVLGYLEGLARSSRSPAILAVVLTFAVVMTLIADLDRPAEGNLRLSPQLMIDLEHQLQSEASSA